MDSVANMSLYQTLNEKTSGLHDAIETVPVLTELSKGTICLEQYKQLTSLFYGFWQPAERMLESINLSIPWVSRAHHLHHDLIKLGYSDDDICGISQCMLLPDITTAAQGVGMLYVYQGSQMGGALINKALSNANVIPEECRTFYIPHTSNLAQYWNEFTNAIDHASFSETEITQAVSMARETFLTLTCWLVLPKN